MLLAKGEAMLRITVAVLGCLARRTVSPIWTFGLFYD
jgi:hypothetical protein